MSIMQKARRTESGKRGDGLTRELVLLIVASLVIALDQISKLVVRANMSLGESVPEDGFFRITYITNAGGSWGIFNNTAFLIIATAMIVIAIVVLYLLYPPAKRTLVRVGLGLLLGGAMGNMIDRLSHGRVTDFIDVGAWPVFNIADCAIVIGVFLILIVLYFIFLARREQQLSKAKDD